MFTLCKGPPPPRGRAIKLPGEALGGKESFPLELSFEGETYPKAARASSPPARENGRGLLQHQSSGRKTREASWPKLRLWMEQAAGAERQPEMASTPLAPRGQTKPSLSLSAGEPP
jgi:hypothetical protein